MLSTTTKSVLLYFTFAVVFPAFAQADCTVMVRCDNCSQQAHWEGVASNAAPDNGPDGGTTMSQCTIYIANLAIGDIRGYQVIRQYESGVIYENVLPATVGPQLESAYSDLYFGVQQFESSLQSVSVSGEDYPNSAYDLPGNSQNQDAVHDYIQDNHALADFVWDTLGGIASVVDAAGGDYGPLISINVTFPDGSTAVFRLNVYGLGLAKWEPVPGTLFDADGNEIFLSLSQYQGQSGSFYDEATMQNFIDRMTSGGWDVIPVPASIPTGGGSCSWTCPSSNRCNLECTRP